MTDLRVGDAERDRAAADLGEHFALGRLSADEHAERLDAAWTARTRRDLDVLFHDLPRSATPVPVARPARHHHRPWGRLPWGRLTLLLALLALLTPLPLWVALVPLAAAWFRRAHRRAPARAVLHVR